MAGAAGAGGAGGLVARVLPHSPEAEVGVLACCLIDHQNTLPRCVEAHLTEEAFHSPAHAQVWAVIRALYDRSQPVEDILVIEELTNRHQLESVGGPAFIAQLQSRVPTTLHFEHYLDIVREKHLLRRLIQTCTGTVEKCFRDPGEIHEFIEQVEQEVFALSNERLSDATRPVGEPVKEAMGVINNLIERKGQVQGIPSGFARLDRMTFGFHKGDMIVLAARPSMGKTSLALNFVEHASIPRRTGVSAAHTLVFSLEMTSASLAMRLICGRAGVDMQQLRDGTARKKESLEAVTAAASDFLKAPIKINDSSGLSIGEIRAISRRIHNRVPLDMVVIDYLQLVRGSARTDSREQEVAEISRGVKGLAKELGVPVVVLSQLNRATEKENRPPRLSDLRESGSIEQDADVVLMLAHPEKKTDEEKFSPVQQVDLIVAKQRNGQVGRVPLTFNRSLTRFEDSTEP